MKIVIRKCDDPVCFLRLLGPDNGGAIMAQRKDGERPGRKKMLFGPTTVIALMGDSGDNRGLSIRPAVSRYPGELPQPRANTIRRRDEFSVDLRAVAERNLEVGWISRKVSDRGWEQNHASRYGLAGKRR